MVINADTKIGTIIKANEHAIEALISVSPHFNKLKNPLLRKILASRVTVAEAATIGNTNVEIIFDKLRSLGFETDDKRNAIEDAPSLTINDNSNDKYTLAIDVRDDLSKGIDPFARIMKQLGSMADAETLLLINSFEPFPLIRILGKKNYKISVVKKEIDLIYTFITKTAEDRDEVVPVVSNGEELFSSINERYKDKCIEIDVREMEMPKPMITILDKLDSLKAGEALYVHHKKIPVFLLPELKARGFDYAFKQIDTEVKLIIFPL